MKTEPRTKLNKEDLDKAVFLQNTYYTAWQHYVDSKSLSYGQIASFALDEFYQLTGHLPGRVKLLQDGELKALVRPVMNEQQAHRWLESNS